MLQAIIFDFDGVIADSEPLHLRAYQHVLGKEGIQLTREEYYARYLGFDDSGLFRALAKDRGLAITDDLVDNWIDAKSQVVEELLISDSVLFPEAEACIHALARHVPMAIASGALGPEIELVLDNAGLAGCFRTIASASDGVRGKPAPDLYLLALAQLRELGQVDAANCVAIEDSHWGLEAAKMAGLRTVAVTHTYPADQLRGADLIVERLSEITIKKLEALLLP
jgi:beta-phosphoglucomutase-like phosphatase (HAD superfamily)